MLFRCVLCAVVALLPLGPVAIAQDDIDFEAIDRTLGRELDRLEPEVEDPLDDAIEEAIGPATGPNRLPQRSVTNLPGAPEPTAALPPRSGPSTMDIFGAPTAEFSPPSLTPQGETMMRPRPEPLPAVVTDPAIQRVIDESRAAAERFARGSEAPIDRIMIRQNAAEATPRPDGDGAPPPLMSDPNIAQPVLPSGAVPDRPLVRDGSLPGDAMIERLIGTDRESAVTVRGTAAPPDRSAYQTQGQREIQRRIDRIFGEPPADAIVINNGVGDRF